MQTILVRYETHATRASENEELINAVFSELRERAPVGFRYAAFKLADGVSFMHFALIDTPDGSNPLLALDSFARFGQGIDDRCVTGPAVEHFSTVNEYGLSGAAVRTDQAISAAER